MSFLKAFVTKSVFAAASAPPKGLEAVALFFYGSAPSIEAITALATDAEVRLSQDGSKTRITLSWGDLNTTISIDTAWDKTAQMEGMRGWAERFPARVRELTDVKALIESFDTVTACYGTVTKPGLDPENKVMNLFKALLNNGGGFFFSRNSFYGTDGLRITGYDNDPIWLGTPPPEA